MAFPWQVTKAAAHVAGADGMLKVGGAQAIAALAQVRRSHNVDIQYPHTRLCAMDHTSQPLHTVGVS